MDYLVHLFGHHPPTQPLMDWTLSQWTFPCNTRNVPEKSWTLSPPPGRSHPDCLLSCGQSNCWKSNLISKTHFGTSTSVFFLFFLNFFLKEDFICLIKSISCVTTYSTVRLKVTISPIHSEMNFQIGSQLSSQWAQLTTWAREVAS